MTANPAGGRVHKSILDAVKSNDSPGTFTPTMPKQPTDAAPGSAAKLRTLVARVANGEELWHSADRNCFDETTPINRR